MDTGDPTVKSARQKLLLRMKFKYCVRRVIANIFWLEDEGRVVRRKSEAMDKRPYLNFEVYNLKTPINTIQFKISIL